MNPLSGTNGQLMVTAAHRYCLSRRPYIVSSCQQWLTANWNHFDENTKFVILRDTVENLQDYGDDGGWIEFARWVAAQLGEDSVTRCRDYVAYRHKPWPL